METTAFLFPPAGSRFAAAGSVLVLGGSRVVPAGSLVLLTGRGLGLAGSLVLLAGYGFGLAGSAILGKLSCSPLRSFEGLRRFSLDRRRSVGCPRESSLEPRR
jgi:hypothetical protein